MIQVALVSLAVAFSGAVVPGPLFAMTLAQARLVGWTAGVWLIAGHMLAELALVGLLYAGLGAALKRPAVTRTVGLVGGAVLCYFAWDMAHAAAAPVAAHAGGALSILGLVLRGLVLSVVNPYWYIWWATAGIGLIAAQSATHGRRAWPVFFAGHILGDTLWYVFVAVLIAVSGAFLSDAVFRTLIYACAAGVAVLGLVFAVHAVRGWVKGEG
jgi:threonine/homoserine/homoserine lactone efflux protein